MTVATFPPASLPAQLAELKREKKMRAGVYAHWIASGKIKREVADYQTNALDGAIRTIETLVAASGQPSRRELIGALRDARRALDGEDIAQTLPALDALLARLPP